MKWHCIAFFLFLASCRHNQVEEEIKPHRADSIMKIVQQHHDSSILILHMAEKKTLHLVGVVSNRMDSIHEVHKGLKGEYENFKKNVSTLKIIQRDTIYITEKKNFWGKTKRITDSTSSAFQDTIQNQEQK